MPGNKTIGRDTEVQSKSDRKDHFHVLQVVIQIERSKVQQVME